MVRLEVACRQVCRCVYGLVCWDGVGFSIVWPQSEEDWIGRYVIGCMLPFPSLTAYMFGGVGGGKWEFKVYGT